MSRLSQFVLDLIYPPICLACGSFGQFFCEKCRAKAQILTENICPFCLQKTNDGVKHSKCLGSLEGLVSVFEYEKVTQKYIKEIKYRYYHAGMAELIDFYLENLDNKTFFEFITIKPILTAIPLHPKKMATRGFNQAQLIVKILAKTWQLPSSFKLLQRIKNTIPQAELKKADRIKNLQGAFEPDPRLIKLGNKPLKGKNLIIVDDVWTTGSTLQEAARVLHKLGAERIWGVTVAR